MQIISMPTEFDYELGGKTDHLDRVVMNERLAVIHREHQLVMEEARLARKKALVAFRMGLEDRRASTTLELVADLLGEEPTTADGWAERGELLLRVATVEGTGLNPKAAASYAQECWARAKALDPAKYSERVKLDVDVTVRTLQERLIAARKQAGRLLEHDAG